MTTIKKNSNRADKLITAFAITGYLVVWASGTSIATSIVEHNKKVNEVKEVSDCTSNNKQQLQKHNTQQYTP